jgi:hypothetical protein
MSLGEGDAVVGGEGLNETGRDWMPLVERPEEGGGGVKDEEGREVGTG